VVCFRLPPRRLELCVVRSNPVRVKGGCFFKKKRKLRMKIKAVERTWLQCWWPTMGLLIMQKHYQFLLLDYQGERDSIYIGR
jgi:hypothetical protein